MSRSLIKNPLIINCGFLLTFFSSDYLQAATKYSYQLDYDVKYGVHTVGAPNTATHRHTMEYEQKADYNSQWSSILGLRAEVEAAYASVPDRYANTDVVKYESQALFPKENYLQFKSGSLRARLGFQQIVWGEAFGLYYADIVNPKDYRSGGLGDLSRNRIATPMMNLQWIFSDASIQLLYIPKPMFSILPSQGSDFNNFKTPAGAPAIPIKIQRDAANPPTNGEYGFRYGQQFSGIDFSLFYLNYNDRTPIYEVTFVPAPASLVATPVYKPLQSAGATITYDISGYLLRSEIIQHLQREFNTTDGVNIGSEKSDELVYVVGLDLPTVNKWQTSFQVSESRLKQANWLLRKNTQSSVAARVAKDFGNDVVAESTLTYFTSDSSNLVQASIAFPISNQSEILFGADRFDGQDTSEMGRFKNASRAWVMFKTKLKK